MHAIYLDHAATTPVRPEALEAMAAVHGRPPGNPSSTHRFGRDARALLEDARARLAAALGVDTATVHFVRGGTEGDNLAVLGAVAAAGACGTRPLVVHTAGAHSAIREAAAAAEREGARRTVLPLDVDGQIDAAALDAALARGPTVVSVLWVNNETGAVLPVGDLAARVRAAGALLHVDAVQAVGKVPVDPVVSQVDLAVLTGHKLGGPGGAGALMVRKSTPLAPRIFGGGQERGLRPGTEDVAGAVGLAVAVELAVAEQAAFAERSRRLREALESGLRAGLEDMTVHAGGGPRAPHISNVGIPGTERDILLARLDLEGLAVSGGSACSSGATTQSPVIQALHGTSWEPTAVRFSLGRTTSEGEVAEGVRRTVTAVRAVREAPTGHPSGSTAS